MKEFLKDNKNVAANLIVAVLMALAVAISQCAIAYLFDGRFSAREFLVLLTGWTVGLLLARTFIDFDRLAKGRKKSLLRDASNPWARLAISIFAGVAFGLAVCGMDYLFDNPVTVRDAVIKGIGLAVGVYLIGTFLIPKLPEEPQKKSKARRRKK